MFIVALLLHIFSASKGSQKSALVDKVLQEPSCENNLYISSDYGANERTNLLMSATFFIALQWTR